MANEERPDDLDLPPLPDESELAAAEEQKPPVPVVASQEEKPRVNIHLERDVVPGQTPAPKMNERRVLILLTAASVVILLGAGIWGYFLAVSSGGEEKFAIQYGLTHNLAMEDNLEGRYVTNRPSGKRLFVVSGVVENRFADGDQLSWIRIRGVAYADTEQSTPLGETAAYAGNLLEDSQLTHWELPAIKAYYGFLNGRKDQNLQIPSGTKVPYQLVFPDITGTVKRTVAEVTSYNRRGQSIFVETQ